MNNSVSIGKIIGKNNYSFDTRNIKVSHPGLLDNFVKLSLLSVIAGYLKENKIQVDDSFSKKINLSNLGRFMSYVVNHPVAPIKYSFKITDNKSIRRDKQIEDEIKHKNRSESENNFNYDVILNFSGGLDSTAGLLYCLDSGLKVLPVWIDFNQRNADLERKATKKIIEKLGIESLTIKIDIGKYILSGWKDWNFIVPARNFLFVAIANSIFNKYKKRDGFIFLCANKDEMKKFKHKDKSKYFFNKSAEYFNLDANNNVKIRSPFEKYSKSEFLSWWKKHWERKYGISPLDTTTCYYEKTCGKCKSCFQRTYSLLASGYQIDSDIEVHPFSDPVGYIKNVHLPDTAKGKILRAKSLDFHIALRKCQDIIPKYLSDYYQTIPWQRKKAMERRLAEIKNVKLNRLKLNE